MAVARVVELADTPDLGSGSARIGGSSPLARTTFTNENEVAENVCTVVAQNPARPADKRVKFPVTIRHRSSKVKIYAPAKNFGYYRLSFTTAGKRQLQTFATYSEAKTAGETKVKELHSNSSAASLSAGQSQDALAAFERLAALHQATGRKFSLLGAVSELAEVVTKLGKRSVREAVAGYLQSVVTVKDMRRADQFEVARGELIKTLRVELEQAAAMG